MSDRLLSLQEIVTEKVAPLTYWGLYEMVRKGKVRAYKVGKKWCVDPDELINDLKHRTESNIAQINPPKRRAWQP